MTSPIGPKVKKLSTHLVVLVMIMTMSQASAGVAPLKVQNLRCGHGLTCSVAEGMQEGLTVIDVGGRFPRHAGNAMSLHLLKLEGAGKAQEIRTTKVGVFSHGKLTTSIPAYKLDAGKYAFTFTPANAGFKDHIIAKGEFVITRDQASGSAKPSPGATLSSVVGTWYGTGKTVGTIEMRADGTYSYGGQPAGTYRVNGNNIFFTGSLSAWDNGHAVLTNGNLEFYWTNAQGWKQWFSFAKGR